MILPGKEVIHILSATPGCPSLRELIFLFERASEVTEGVIVEVGAFQGASTVALALGSRAGAGVEVYSIDPHEDIEDSTCPGSFYGPGDRKPFMESVLRAEVADLVRPIFLKNSDLLAQMILDVGLLFIDGDHLHPQPLLDARAWERRVLSGGQVVLDDVNQDGPFRALKWLVEEAGFEEGPGCRLMKSVRRPN